MKLKLTLVSLTLAIAFISNAHSQETCSVRSKFKELTKGENKEAICKQTRIALMKENPELGKNTSITVNIPTRKEHSLELRTINIFQESRYLTTRVGTLHWGRHYNYVVLGDPAVTDRRDPPTSSRNNFELENCKIETEFSQYVDEKMNLKICSEVEKLVKQRGVFLTKESGIDIDLSEVHLKNNEDFSLKLETIQIFNRVTQAASARFEGFFHVVDGVDTLEFSPYRPSSGDYDCRN